MTFGKRAALPPFQTPTEPAQPMARRGGYLLAVLTVGVTSYLCTLSMTFIPDFNPTSRTLTEIAMMSVAAVLNVTGVAAIILALMDVVLRRLKVSAVWVYGAASGVLTFGFCYWLALALDASSLSPAFMAMMVLVPATMGGSVLGLFRRR